MSLYRVSKRKDFSPSLTNKCIILDLDETLVHTFDNFSDLEGLRPFSDPEMLDLRRRMYTFSLGSYKQAPTMWGVIRPHTDEFLEFCFSYFDKVCVWSAGLPEYVTKIVNILFDRQPHCVHSRNHCSYAVDGNIIKPITEMSKNMEWQKELRLDNTFFVDDRETAFIKNPYNGIVIPPYEPPASIDGFLSDDPTLPQLMDWFLLPDVIRSKDVRFLEKDYIFY